MATSEARVLANRNNAARSTGPKTAEGKEHSRQNGLKHGMTGQGVVLPGPDVAAVEECNTKLQKELAPRTAMGVILVRQMAVLSVRMDRSTRQEFAAVARNVRHARDDFDEARLDEAEHLLSHLADDPRSHRRKLRRMPEGVELMIETWSDLRANLVGSHPVWNASHLSLAAALLGSRPEMARTSRIGNLSRAIWGDFEGLSDTQGGGLDDQARQGWARTQLIALIDQEIADLEAHYETLDFETIEKDRAEAGSRALFDPSKQACLARRYESEARRAFFKAYEELKRVEQAAAEDRALEQAPATTTSTKVCDPLGSSCVRPAKPPRPTVPGALYPVSVDVSDLARMVRGADGEPLRIGKVR